MIIRVKSRRHDSGIFSRPSACRPYAVTVLLLCGVGIFSIFQQGCSQQGSISGAVPQSIGHVPEDTCTDKDREGLAFYRRGKFEQAIESWSSAAGLCDQEKNLNLKSDVLIRLSQAYLAVGHYKKSIACLEDSLTISEKLGNQNRIAAILGRLGNVYIAVGPPDKAYKYLKEGSGLARELGSIGVLADILNNLGNFHASRNNDKKAIQAYTEAKALAEQSGNRLLAGRSAANAAALHIRNGRHQLSKSLLDEAFNQTRRLADSHEKAYGMINIGLSYVDLNKHRADPENRLLSLAFEAFDEAGRTAEHIGDLRALSYARGYVGQLYETEKRYQEALQLTRQANHAAQQVHSPESLYLWQWQIGRIFRALGEMDAAISAYKRAVDTLQNIRQELSVTYGSRQSTFRESIGPVYFELVDLLLKRADTVQDRALYERCLIEAREVVELLKVAELRDYFEDECVVADRSEKTSLDIVSRSAVVVYPILLEDRTELLVSLPGRIERFTVPVGSSVLTKEIRRFRSRLEKRTTHQYLQHAQRLYDWLIRPFEPSLKDIPVETLVFVPDGPLRTIPMAALHDGKQFLIDKYALAITPSLNLTDPRPIDREKIRVLSMGLTEASQGFPALPFVTEEIQTIQRLYKGKVLMNNNFLLSSLENTLLEESYTVIHIASHGQFTGDRRKTFLLTFDGKLTMERLDHCIGLFRYRDEPLELLALSACETASGDDRAALGLAGIAVGAGARSALATLWKIYDQASSELVSEFYRQLRQPAMSRGKALQRAQLKLLNDPRYRHPCYWAPFILINNWL